MPTIRDIAEMCGVSRSTVSLVLNSSPLVKADTREKVLRVMKETGYVPNANARSLGWRATKALGVIVLTENEDGAAYDFHHSTGLFSLSVLKGISERVSESDYSMQLEYFRYSEEQEDAIPKLLAQRKVDGAVLVGGFWKKELLTACRQTGIPLVIVGVDPETEELDSVMALPQEGTYQALKRMYEAGRRQLGLLNCPASFRSAEPRTAAFKKFCGDFHIPFDESRVLYCKHNNGASAYEAIKNCGISFDGLVTANPQCAFGALRGLEEKGLRVPGNVSVIAYEDSVMCAYAAPPLTAFNIQKEEMGRRAAEMLLKRLKEPEMPPMREILEGYMVERGSV